MGDRWMRVECAGFWDFVVFVHRGALGLDVRLSGRFCCPRYWPHLEIISLAFVARNCNLR